MPAMVSSGYVIALRWCGVIYAAAARQWPFSRLFAVLSPL